MNSRYFGHILLGVLLPALSVAGGCSDADEDFDIAPENKVNPGEMVLNMGRSIAGDNVLTENTRLYQFHDYTDSTGNGTYVACPKLTRADNKITFQLGEGWWSFNLVSSHAASVTDSVITPEYGKRADECPMWRQKSVGGALISMPEIYTASIDNFHFSGKWVSDDNGVTDYFKPDKDYNATADFTRNVAMLRVTFAESEDLDPAQLQKISISNVPVALNWRGGLYPNPHSPEVSAVPIRGAFNIHNVEGKENTTKSDETLTYIIAAHKGTSEADTTTSFLRLNVDLTCTDGTHMVKTDILLPRTPKVNGIYDIEVSYNKRKLNIATEVLPWVDENASASAGNTTIITSKPTVELATLDTIAIECPTHPAFTVSRDQEWITLTKLPNNRFKVEARASDYEPGHPREGNIIVKAGNLEKRIPVRQRPDEGTIDVHVAGQPNVREMWLSPPHNKKGVDVYTIGGGWKILPNLRVYNTPTGGVGQTNNVMLTRFSDEDIDFSDFNKAFGRERVVFMNTATLDTASIWVDNLYIGLGDDIVEIDQPQGVASRIVSTDLLKVYGGNRDINILSLPDFVLPSGTRYDKNTGLFYFNSKSHPEGEDQWGKIKLSHKSDADYTVELYIDQAILVTIPEFDYLVLTIKWETGADIDQYTGLDGNATSYFYRDYNYNTSKNSLINSKYVGWCAGNTKTHMLVDYNTGESKDVITWGGDNTDASAGESVFLNAPLLNAYPYPGQKGIDKTSANYMTRVVNMNVRAGWYSNKGPGNIIVSVVAYRGGTMKLESDKQFYNNGGTKVYETRCRFNNVSNAEANCSSNNKTGSLKRFADIKYDRKKHTAKIDWGTGGTVELDKIY